MRSAPRNVGILGMEIYIPKSYVSQADLEVFDNVSKGKYTIGLGQSSMSFVRDYEDVNSMAMTVCQNLLDKYNVCPKNIGRLEIGTETIIDKSKSCKTVLMELFRKHGNHNIEGITNLNACYGGTAGLFNCVNWVQSESWDGRFAIAIATDIAIYAKGTARPTGGAGAVAMLIGPDAPLVVERFRHSYFDHQYDFYKPDIQSEYPTVDGQLTVVNFLKAVTNCYQGLKLRVMGETNQLVSVDSVDYFCFHTPYCKQTFKSFTTLVQMDLKAKNITGESISPQIAEAIEKIYKNPNPDPKEIDKIAAEYFKLKCQPSLSLSNQLGNIYTGSLFACLISLVNNPKLSLENKRISLFSFGSGLASSMYLIKVNSDPSFMREKLDIENRLKSRTKVSPEEYDQIMALRQQNYGKKNLTTNLKLELLEEGSYYLTQIDDKIRRHYGRKSSKNTETINESGEKLKPKL